MKTVAVESTELTLEQLLQEAAQDDVIFLTKNGETQGAIVAADDADQEVFAISSNPKLVEALNHFVERSRSRPRKTIEQIQAEHQIPDLP